MKITTLLIDLDGVLYVGDSPVPGAAGAIEFLDEHGYSYRFVSNTTRKSRETIARRLEGMGFAVPASSIITPAAAAVNVFSGERKSRIFLLTTGDVRDEFEAAGFSHSEGPADYVVVGDAGENFTYNQMNAAFQRIVEGAEIIALEKDRYWMGTEGLMLSAGPFVAGLEYATGRSARVIGKPSTDFFGLALASMGAEPSRTLMIGDDIDTDIGGAARCGIKGILVKTGKFREEALHRAPIKPYRIIGSLASLPAVLEGLAH